VAADGGAHQRLGGIGDAVKAQGRQDVELQQDMGRCQHILAHAAGPAQEHAQRRQQQKRPQKEIAIDGQQGAKAGKAPKAAVPEGGSKQPQRQDGKEDAGTSDASGGFRDQAGARRASDAPAQPDDEPNRQHGVEKVQHDFQRHGGGGSLGADQKADDRQLDQREGQAVKPDRQVQAGIARGGLGDVHGRQHPVSEGRLDRQQAGTDHQRQKQAARDHPHHAAGRARAEGLRDEPGGAHAQKAHGPVQRGENEHRYGQRRQGRHRRQMADGPCVDQPDQAGRGIGQHGRPGDAPDAPVGMHGHRRQGHARSIRPVLLSMGQPPARPPFFCRMVLLNTKDEIARRIV